jgi:hypothetical protein
MGSYTPQLKFYKPDSTEFIDVETQLNANWDIADNAVKHLMEYEYTTAQTPEIVGALNWSRFYKTYSNSIQGYYRPGAFFYQDPGSYVNTWDSAAGFWQNSYVEDPEYPMFVRVIETPAYTTTKTVEWCGALWLGGTNLPVNTDVTIAAAGSVPAKYRPTTAKYFTVSAGNSNTNYSIARIAIFTDGAVQYKRYGDAAVANSSEARLEFTGIRYNLEVTGT